MKKTFKKGGIHPKDHKVTADCPITAIPAVEEVTLLMTQNIGAPSQPIVKAGDKVGKWQKVANAGGFVGAPVHSPVHGTVKRVDSVVDFQGLHRQAIVIAASEEAPEGWTEPEGRTAAQVEQLTPEAIVGIVDEAGIVGLGGAAFPTKVKLMPPLGKTVDMVLINGAECEPWLTCDDQLMRAHASEIVKGAELICRAVKVRTCIVGIEDNKPQAIAAMRRAAEECTSVSVSVVVLKKKYPQGGEKQLIQALTGRVVPEGQLPLDVGVIVDNVATAYAVWDAVWRGRPLVERVVTVTGPDVEGGNYLVPLGTPATALLEAVGGMPESTGKLVAGGPMMGRAISHPEAPSVKGFSGLLCIPERQARRHASGPCIRCTKCVTVCPMGLEPYLLMTLSEFADTEQLAARHVMTCIECGSCSYVCPSSRPLLDFIKNGKGLLRKKK